MPVNFTPNPSNSTSGIPKDLTAGQIAKLVLGGAAAVGVTILAFGSAIVLASRGVRALDQMGMTDEQKSLAAARKMGDLSHPTVRAEFDARNLLDIEEARAEGAGYAARTMASAAAPKVDVSTHTY